MASKFEKVAPAGMFLSVTNSIVARQPHSPPQSTLVSSSSNLSLLQCAARHVSSLRPTLLPLPGTQDAPLTHWSLAEHTPSALAQGHSAVHSRSEAVLHSGSSIRSHGAPLAQTRSRLRFGGVTSHSSAAQLVSVRQTEPSSYSSTP